MFLDTRIVRVWKLSSEAQGAPPFAGTAEEVFVKRVCFPKNKKIGSYLKTKNIKRTFRVNPGARGRFKI